MRARWEGLHAALLRSVRTLRADRKFKQVAQIHHELKRFQSADGLTAFLNANVDSTVEGRRALDEKDRIYAFLVGVVQSRSDWRDLALAILWLGLWPGLDAVYRHRLRDFVGRVAELVTEISFVFTATIGRIDLSGVNRLASTLIKNVERDVRQGLKQRWADGAQAEDIDRFENDGHLQTKLANEDRALPIDAADPVAVRSWLFGIVRDDADLVIGVALFGFDLHELADGLGIAHDAARKRFQRAIGRIRKRLGRS
jgi:DNA-directed RNA polymerase specialized sigma24 family protein